MGLTRADHLIGLLALIWGNSFLLIKIGEHAYDPGQLTTLRLVSGLAVVTAVAIVTRERLPGRARTWAHLCVVAALQNAIPWTLFAVGETSTSSIVAGLCNATTPLSTVLFAFALLPGERLGRDRLFGVAVGFAGVCLLLGVWRGLDGRSAVGTLLCLVAATCYGLGAPYHRRFLAGSGYSVVSLTTAQLLCATIQISAFTAWHSTLRLHPDAGALVAALVLGVVGSGLAYLIYNTIITLAGASAASMVTYLVPVIATVLGASVLHEPVQWFQPVGMAVVLTGVAMSTGRLTATRRVPVP